MVHGVRIRLSMQGTQVRFLVQEDSTCYRATKPLHHIFCARALWLPKHTSLEPVLSNRRSHYNQKPTHSKEQPPALQDQREPVQSNTDPGQPNINKDGQSIVVTCLDWKLILKAPGDSDGKASACNTRDPGLILGLGRSPGEGNGNPLQYSCLENPRDGGAWSMGSQRVGHDWATSLHFTSLHPKSVLIPGYWGLRL